MPEKAKIDQEKLARIIEYISILSLDVPVKNLLIEMVKGNISKEFVKNELDIFLSEVFTTIDEMMGRVR